MLRHVGDENDRVGLPVHLLSRRILTHATSYAEAAAMSHDTKVCASTSLTVLDRERGATVEQFPDGPGVVEPPDLFFFQAEDGIRDLTVTGVQTCALPI